MTITFELTGADRLAATAHQAAQAIGDLTQVNLAAGALVVGSADIPTRTGALAASVSVEADAVGSTLRAGGASAPYAGYVAARNPFFFDAITARQAQIVALYLDALTDAVATLKGT